MEWNHFDENGNAVMVDVSEKEITERIAVASGKIRVNDAVMSAIVNHTAKKGDVLTVARVAGIMGTKQTSNLIPMCHPLCLNKCTVDFEVKEAENIIKALCTVKVSGKTGVEMEPLMRVQLKALVAQRLFDTGAFYRVMNPAQNGAYRRAVEILGGWEREGAPLLMPEN